jgi:CheY-like chemotaxis protein
VSRVLLIDDEPGIRFALRRFFERAEWTVLEAADGTIALETLRVLVAATEPPVDLVLLDLHLPGVDGAELLAYIRAELPALLPRVVLTTGDAVEDAEPGSALAEHPHVLQKPFDLVTLRGVVAGIVSG